MMKKSEVLEIIQRRKTDCYKIMAGFHSKALRDRAAGAWTVLVSLEQEIEEKGTKAEREEYPTFL